MSKKLDLIGQKYGRLIVVKEGTRGAANCEGVSPRRWECVCDCGGKKLVIQGDLRTGNTVSCGCFSRENTKQVNTKHGHVCGREPSPTYNSWASMKQRTSNSNHSNYKYYGGRGIKVCERWVKFANFLADMGERPEGKTIDRIDNEGDYEPSNCRWTTQKEQVRNRRINKSYTIDGQTKGLGDWCEKFNIGYTKVSQRINTLNWSVEKALEISK